jgi:hypothetical protein
MDLVDYLITLDAGNHEPPDTLVPPERFVVELAKIAVSSELQGLEHGCSLLCDRRSRILRYGTVEVGGPTSMNIPVSTHPDNFGNLHGHPSASIGHAGGHSAHSMLDLANFADTRARPYFIQFVASGPWIYAMVQVKDVSTWDDTAKPFLFKLKGTEDGDILEAMVLAAGGEDAYVERRAAVGADADRLDALLTELKNKGSVGSLMQTLSVQNCKAFAEKYHFFFYAGEDVLTRAA